MTTATYIPAERESHWYDKDGKPVHTVPVAESTRKKKMRETPAHGQAQCQDLERCPIHGWPVRNTTAADAKALELLASVTNILDVVHRFVLEAWKDNRLVLAALQTARQPGETDEDFAARIIEWAEAPATEAADLGTKIHQGIEGFLRHNRQCTPEAKPFVDGFWRWWSNQGITPIQMEKPFACVGEGYGGTADIVAWNGKPFIIDWTTTANPELPVYPEKFAQVAAYRRGLDIEVGGGAIVVISSTEPGAIKPYEIEEHEWDTHWRGFAGARDVFYSPMGKGKDVQWWRAG